MEVSCPEKKGKEHKKRGKKRGTAETEEQASVQVFQEALAKAENKVREMERLLSKMEERVMAEKQRRLEYEHENSTLMQELRGSQNYSFYTLYSKEEYRRMMHRGSKKVDKPEAEQEAAEQVKQQEDQAVVQEAPKEQEDVVEKRQEEQQQDEPKQEEKHEEQQEQPQQEAEPKTVVVGCSEEHPCQVAKKIREALLAKSRQCTELEQQVSVLADAANKERDLFRTREAQLQARIEGLTRTIETLKYKQEGKLERTRADKTEKELRALMAEEREFYEQQIARMDEHLRVMVAVCDGQRVAESSAVAVSAAIKATTAKAVTSEAQTTEAAAQVEGVDSSCGSESRSSTGTASQAATDETTTPRSAASDEASETQKQTQALLSPPQLKARKRDLKVALAEYRNFEEAFMETLELVDSTFRKTLESKVVADPITRSRLPNLFTNMDTIRMVQNEVVSQAKKLCSKRGVPGLGKLFADIVSISPVYEKYHNEFEQTLLLLSEFQKAPSFSGLVAKIEAKSVCGGKSLLEFLLVPIEHYTQYQRMLVAIVQALPSDNAEKESLERALVKLNKVAPAWLERLDDARSTCQVLTASARLQGGPVPLLQPHRRYLVESLATLIDERGRVHWRYLVAFNDLLVMCREHWKSSTKTEANRVLKVVSCVSLADTAVSGVDDSEGIPHALLLTSGTTANVVSLATSGQKKIWLAKLSKALPVVPYDPAKIPVKIATKSPAKGSKEHAQEGYRRAPSPTSGKKDSGHMSSKAPLMRHVSCATTGTSQLQIEQQIDTSTMHRP